MKSKREIIRNKHFTSKKNDFIFQIFDQIKVSGVTL